MAVFMASPTITGLTVRCSAPTSARPTPRASSFSLGGGRRQCLYVLSSAVAVKSFAADESPLSGVKENAQKAGDVAQKGLDSADEKIKEGSKAAGEGLDSASDAAGKEYEKGLDAAGKNVDAASEAVKKGLDAAGKQVDSASKAVKQGIDDAVKKMQ